MKYGRTYTLFVDGRDAQHTIAAPITLDFEVNRSVLASANTGRFTIRNLKESTRRDIFHEYFDTLNFKHIQLAAGYQKQYPLPVIFDGNIISAESYREGPDFVTNIEAFDGGFGIVNGSFAGSFPQGTPNSQMIKALLGSMPNVIPGAVGAVDGQASQRGTVLVGNSWDLIQGLVPSTNTFIDNGRANVLRRDEFLAKTPGEIVLSSDSGMIGTPRRRQVTLEIDMIFEPRIVVGQQVVVKSLEAVNNGTYQVTGVKHRGTISGAVAGKCITTVSVNTGFQSLKPVFSLT